METEITVTDTVSDFARMMKCKLHLRGCHPGPNEWHSWLRLVSRAKPLAPAIPALKLMLDAWMLQEQREAEEVHLSQEAMQRMWHQAMEAGETYVKAQLAAEDAAKAENASSAALLQERPPGRPQSAHKALKRRYAAYLQAFRDAPPDTTHAQWLRLLARAEGFAAFQALRTQLDTENPAFCAMCGSAGTLKSEQGQLHCSGCGGCFSFSLQASAVASFPSAAGAGA